MFPLCKVIDFRWLKAGTKVVVQTMPRHEPFSPSPLPVFALSPLRNVVTTSQSRKSLFQHWLGIKGLGIGCKGNMFIFHYHRFPWYATFENKIPAETFPKFPSIIHVVDRSDRNSPITVCLAWREEGVKVTLVAVIGEFRSDLSITRKTDGNFRNVSAGVLFSKVAYQGKRW